MRRDLQFAQLTNYKQFPMCRVEEPKQPEGLNELRSQIPAFREVGHSEFVCQVTGKAKQRGSYET